MPLSAKRSDAPFRTGCDRRGSYSVRLAGMLGGGSPEPGYAKALLEQGEPDLAEDKGVW
jgi:hypothetical protein